MGNVRVQLKFIFAGVFFLLGAIAWSVFAAPVITQLPKDFSFTADIVSVDNFYSEERGIYEGGVYSKTDYEYRTLAESKGVLSIQNTFSVRTPDDEPVFAVEREYGVDRLSGAHVLGFGDRDRQGYLFAPKDLEEGEPFVYWHINYDGPAQMSFVKEEMLYGLRVFHYETFYEDTIIDQTQDLTFLPEVGISRGVVVEPHLELWIEPVTGRLIKYRDDTIAYYYDLATKEKIRPWNRFSNTFNEVSVEANADVAQWEKVKTRTVEWYIPAILLFIGMFFLTKSAGFIDFVSQQISLDVARRVAALFIIAIAFISLLGWVLDIQSLTRIVPHANAMNPLTALCFILLGGVMLFRNVYSGRISILIGLVLVGVSGIRLLEFLFPTTFQIDLVFFTEAILASDFPARMALYTASSFFLLGLVPLCVRIRFFLRVRLAEILTSLTVLLSLVALAAFFFGALPFLAIPFFFFAAVHTTLLFLLAGIVMYFTNYVRDEYALSISSLMSVTGALLITLLVTMAFAGTLTVFFKNSARAQFETETARAAQMIESRMLVYAGVLEGAEGLLSASDSVEREEWRAYVESISLDENYPGIQAVGYSVFVTPEAYDDHVAQVREEGFSDYMIRPEGERDPYTAIVYIEPFDFRNQQAFGYDMFSNEVRRTAMEQARDSGRPKLSGKITLVQEIDDDVQAGFLVYVPFYRNGEPHETLVEKRSNIVGYAYGAFRVRDFVEGTLGHEGLEDISLAIYDGVIQSDETLLHTNHNTEDVTSSARFSDTVTVYLAGRPWTLIFTSTSDYGVNTFSRFVIPLVVAVGLGISALIAFSFYVLTSARQQAVVYADRATKSLQEAKAKDEAILASVGEGLVFTDLERKVVFANQVAGEILGWRVEEMIGKKWTDIAKVHVEDAEPAVLKDLPIEKVLDASSQNITTATSDTYFYTKKDGTSVPVGITASSVAVQEKIIGAIVVFRDITREKEIDKTKTEFVSLASHQLRTPLSTINWYAEMLLSGDAGKVNKTQKKYIEEIYTGNQRMVELVNALLNVSRLELGTFVMEPESLNVNALIRSVLKEQKPQIDAKKQKVTKELAKDLPCAYADPKLIRMVIQNLLSNAVKYTSEKGKLSIKTGGTKKMLEIEVADTGWGIPKDQQDKIFTKLFRADNVREQDAEGTGLGLYIVKSVVERSGGSLSFESEEEKGTTFFVSLPAIDVKHTESAKKPTKWKKKK